MRLNSLEQLKNVLRRVIQWCQVYGKRHLGVFIINQKERPDNLLCPGIDGDSDIIIAQCFLRKMGFPIGSTGPNQDGVDGVMGDMTEAAVSIFQKMVSIKADGSLNRETLTELNHACQNGMDFRSLTFQACEKRIRPNFITDGERAIFVNTVYYYAVIDEQEMKIPAAATTAQAILETGYGRFIPTDKDTGKFSYNLFGIKGVGPAGTVASIAHEEDVNSGRWKPEIQRFRAYYSFEESIKDHSRFFYDNQRYREALETKTSEDFVQKIARAGYATDSKYAAKLIAVIRYWGLK